MKRIFLASIFFMSSWMQKISAQALQFDFSDSIPVIVNGDSLRNAWAGGINFPLFSEIDLNGDGIHDLFVFDQSNSRISTFINDGTPGITAWHYAPEYISKFPPVFKWVLLYDFNCDGKMDLFTCASSQDGMTVYRNDFDAGQGGLRFTLVTPELKEEYPFPVGFMAPIFASQVQLPTFGDVDNDGDMDIIGSTTTPGRVVFNKNYSVEHGHGCDSLDFKLDTETWGNFIVGINNQSIYTKTDCFNCRMKPRIPENYFFSNYDQSVAAPRDDSFFSIFLIDLNGDHAQDLLIGDVGAINTLMLMNGGTPAAAQMISEDTIFPSYDVPAVFNNFHNHAYMDVDNDGIKDLLAEAAGFENCHSGVWFYKNTATTASPVFSLQTTSFLTNQMMDVGEGACPVLFDADGDGLLDLVVGNFGISQNSSGTMLNGLHLFKNTGTISSPAFQLVDTDYAGISSLFINGPIYPAFGDLDGDGDKDLITGQANGKLQYFTNIGGSPANFQLTGINYMAIDVGNASTPQLFDLNHDNKLDLLTGAQNGHINYFENAGTVNVPSFSNTPTNATLGGIVIHTGTGNTGYTVPYFFDDHGHTKLLLSCGGGDVLLYDSIDGNLSGNFHFVDTIVTAVQGVRDQFNLAVSGGDLNNDGLTDMLLGIYSGGVTIYMQKDLSIAVNNLPDVKSSFTMGPNPANEEVLVRFQNLSPGNKNQLNILNYLGQKVFSKSITSNQLLIDTRMYPSGVYMIQLLTSGNSYVEKLVISR